MSDRDVKTFHGDNTSSPSCDDNLKERELLHTHQSGWMSRWMQRTNMPTPSMNNHSSVYHIGQNAGERKFLASGLKITPDTSITAKRGRNSSKARTIGAINRNLITEVKNFSSERHCYQPICNLSQNPVNDKAEGSSGVRKIVPSSIAVAVFGEDVLQRHNTLPSQSNLKSFGGSVTSHLSLEREDVAASRSSEENVRSSTSGTMPCVFNHANTPNSALLHRRDGMNTKLAHLYQGHGKDQQHPTFLFHQKKMDNHLNPVLRQNDGPLMQHSLSTSTCGNFLPLLFQNQHQKMPNCSNVGVFPSCSNPPDSTESEKLHQGCNPFANIRSSVRNVKTMSGHEELKESTVSNQHKGLMFNEHVRLSPDIGSHWPHGVRVQPLWSITHDKEKENISNSKASNVVSKDESSTETDKMDMDALQKDVTVGMASSLSNKDILDLNVQKTAVDSCTENIGEIPATETVPDINEELPGLQGEASSRNGIKPSMDAENLLSYDEQQSESKSKPSQDRALGLESSSRWVKRLKRSSSDFLGLGTKNSNMEEASSNDKIRFFNRITECSRRNSEHRLRRHHAEALEALGQNMGLVKDDDSSSLGGMMESQGQMLTHSWVQRWLHNHSLTSLRNPEAFVICEPESSKLVVDDLEKKQFPSIDAMALMGKAMKGFRSCEFTRRGPVTVWNARTTETPAE
ncbi:hypothetical protein Ancab_027416 [Ancistrocladus abbreviatus]